MHTYSFVHILEVYFFRYDNPGKTNRPPPLLDLMLRRSKFQPFFSAFRSIFLLIFFRPLIDNVDLLLREMLQVQGKREFVNILKEKKVNERETKREIERNEGKQKYISPEMIISSPLHG